MLLVLWDPGAEHNLYKVLVTKTEVVGLVRKGKLSYQHIVSQYFNKSMVLIKPLQISFWANSSEKIVRLEVTPGAVVEVAGLLSGRVVQNSQFHIF